MFRRVVADGAADLDCEWDWELEVSASWPGRDREDRAASRELSATDCALHGSISARCWDCRSSTTDGGAAISWGAYLAYRAAVDREQAAAWDLQRLSELTQPYQERLARSE